jgi:hypothetical protein
MKALRTFIDFEKEEAWLNRKADSGQLLNNAGLLYSFNSVKPHTATVRVDYRPQMSPIDFADYLTLFSDAGWRHLAGSRSGGPQYFATFSGNADADIFSEPVSKMQRYRRATTMSALLLLPLLAVVFSLASLGNISLDSALSPQDWYLTRGLWQMDGWEFTRAFLFETPFVVLRVGAPFLLVATCLALLVRMIRQMVLYHRYSRTHLAA